MRGTRRKKLALIFNEVVQRGLIPQKTEKNPKLQWRRFKKMYMTGELWAIFPSM